MKLGQFPFRIKATVTPIPTTILHLLLIIVNLRCVADSHYPVFEDIGIDMMICPHQPSLTTKYSSGSRLGFQACEADDSVTSDVQWRSVCIKWTRPCKYGHVTPAGDSHCWITYSFFQVRLASQVGISLWSAVFLSLRDYVLATCIFSQSKSTLCLSGIRLTR